MGHQVGVFMLFFSFFWAGPSVVMFSFRMPLIGCKHALLECKSNQLLSA